jgi:hypothetical protein
MGMTMAKDDTIYGAIRKGQLLALLATLPPIRSSRIRRSRSIEKTVIENLELPELFGYFAV